jgi:hypothetical protein
MLWLCGNLMRVETLADVVGACCNEILGDFPDAGAVFFYGSFSYRNLDASLSDKDVADLRSSSGRKPDFIVVVPDLAEAVDCLGDKYDWSSSVRKRVLGFRRDTPSFFNVEAFHRHELRDAPFFPRYKIGVIEEDGFSQACKMENGNIYLPSRLSKFVNVVHRDGCDAVSALDGVRDYFVDLALRLVPAKFSGEEFARAYLLSTYLAEAYRVFDIFKKKHLSILDARVYDWDAGQVVPMRAELEKIFSARLLSRGIGRDGSDFYDSVFTNPKSAARGSVLRDFLLFNLCSARVSFGKNRVTNSACGGNNLGYIWRKFTKK